jgi:hypothetical protein
VHGQVRPLGKKVAQQAAGVLAGAAAKGCTDRRSTRPCQSDWSVQHDKPSPCPDHRSGSGATPAERS